MAASYELIVHWEKLGVPFQNKLHYLSSQTDATFSEAAEIAVNFGSGAMQIALCSCVGTDVFLKGVTCRSVIAVGGSASATPTAVYIQNDPGTRATASETSNQNGPLITYLPATLVGERARVNKIFIPTLLKADAEDDIVSAGLQTDLANLVSALIAAFTVSSGPLVWIGIITQVVAGPPPVRVKYVRAIMAAAVETFVASQRRRRPRTAV